MLIHCCCMFLHIAIEIPKALIFCTLVLLWSRLVVLTGDRSLTKTTSRHLLKHALSLFKNSVSRAPTSAYNRRARDTPPLQRRVVMEHNSQPNKRVANLQNNA